jgi:hypothetical protein
MFLRRPMSPGLSGELARFFFSCASEMNPELSVASVEDPLSGLELRVLSSTDSEVELEVQVRGEDSDGMSTTLENWSVSTVKSEHFSTIGE